MRNLYAIKSQDILLLLKMLVDPDETQQELAQNLGISQTEVSLGLRRLKNSGLLNSEGAVSKEASIEFLVHGLKYVFPAEFGTLAAGIPTSYAKPGFKFVKYKDDDLYVWAHPKGSVRGIVIKPIHPSFPEACLKDEKLYTLASLVEMIRSGRAREKNIAANELSKMVEGA
ncbi:MAG: helix-turn-helix transcriptional regulator [Bdellovibrionaceae bacterium]|nr:helix-turn-helix transcriptional regulator [Pseudobdellovibrionaceae bacterium]